MCSMRNMRVLEEDPDEGQCGIIIFLWVLMMSGLGGFLTVMILPRRGVIVSWTVRRLSGD